MTAEAFIPSPYQQKPAKGSHSWKSPSNIALVKYWGKTTPQIPANPSISFTLNNCHTITTLTYTKQTTVSADFSFDVFLDGELKPGFAPKIEVFLKRIEIYMPFLKEYHFKIETSNSFPHSSGIASSASGMSALALCLMSMEREFVANMDDGLFLKKASFLARLGSGSACRSIEGPIVTWGTHKEIKNSSDFYGILYTEEVNDVFKNYQDTILLVDVGEKRVSSTVGHNLMNNHPFAEERFVQANSNLSKLRSIFKSGNLEKFIEVVESEALTLHAMMMTSMPYFILMKPNTLKIIEKVWEYRKETGSHLCFTLDAGANVHLLYPEAEKETVLQFIKNELVAYCKKGKYICDQIGFGARKL
ncbi:diphosphomevalonate/mevalonate 3,5-bisphosphate decarboxylase family protein [Galbibacter pacificus]|uniref:Diphosphomevalonate decarboxylase n=1 Tax=Galbibacter pacificus TaxID=2996052 RepID=A0ABT6FWS7_9FLAO|nr:diphosphomevalonate decarboxylase [Galbibacter pacificus]MDG3584006.1 diphosphomevalonate decarboxylase [Galbibacter pacificus]MDG3587557.1 diphosphomevalonate decarboxylase [Galbibacter pacificus]